MYKFNRDGNSGRCYPEPGEVAQAECGICGTQMNVDRNVNGPVCFAEAMGPIGYLHDRFTCPNFTESWHKRIGYLKRDAVIRSFQAGSEDDAKDDLEKKVAKILAEVEGEHQ